MSIADIELFLKNIYPFELLNDYQIKKIVDHIIIEYYKQNQPIEDTKNYLYIVLKGVIVERDSLGKDIAYYSKSNIFDVNSVLNGSENVFETLEESILYKIDKEIIKEIILENQPFGEYFKKTFKEKISSIASNNPYLFLKVKDIQLQSPLILNHNTSIYDSVKEMTEKGSYSIIVDFKDSYGIVTDSDLRKKVILNNIPTTQPIGSIANKNLITIDLDSFLFDAILKMMKHNIKRIVVVDGKDIVGVLNEIDLLTLYSNQPQFIALKIERSKSIEELKTISDSIVRLIRILFKEGIKTRHIMKFISEINTRLFRKTFLLTFPEDLQNHLTLIVMGSEGREEQILKTDQDNGLILEDTFKVNQDLEKLSKQFIENLKMLGYPECKGNVMISNQYWRKPLNDYKNSIIEYINNITPENMLNFAILVDSKYIIGREDLYEELIEFLFKKISDNKTFLSYFALPTIQFKTPLTFFGTFETEKGEHKGELDIKKGGIFSIVHGVRSLSVENKIRETNTFERIKNLSDLGVINKEFAMELIETLEYLLTLRLREKLKKIEIGKNPDDYINVNQLSNFERDLLKDSFKIVNKFKDFITNHFKLNYIS